MRPYIERHPQARPEANIPPLTLPPRQPDPELEPDSEGLTEVEKAQNAVEFAMTQVDIAKVARREVDRDLAQVDQWLGSVQIELQRALDALKRAEA